MIKIKIIDNIANKCPMCSYRVEDLVQRLGWRVCWFLVPMTTTYPWVPGSVPLVSPRSLASPGLASWGLGWQGESPSLLWPSLPSSWAPLSQCQGHCHPGSSSCRCTECPDGSRSENTGFILDKQTGTGNITRLYTSKSNKLK